MGLYPYALPTGFVGCAARAHAIRSVDFCRQFYKTYPKGNALRSQLNWSQYRMLIQISDPDKGKISTAEAMQKAENEYDIFNRTQRIDSDFDKEIRGMLGDTK